MPVSRLAIFIDAGYLEKVLLKEFPGTRIDFGKLSTELAKGEELLRTYFTTVLPTKAVLRLQRNPREKPAPTPSTPR